MFCMDGGPTPAIVVLDLENGREVISKGNIFQRPPGRAITRLMAKGIISLETDKWAKHRRLLNPAFHVEKIKVIISEYIFFLPPKTRK